ncbi:hypothetical protein OIO90_001004 [Microbotryomycetes sp. JL221]|nr:hypothetical protein OIO90_001004 [Microbotryomycetes sp. JL221]
MAGEFANGFFEDDDPKLAARTSEAATAQAKSDGGPCGNSSVVDLTNSPPSTSTILPSDYSRNNKPQLSSLAALESWLGNDTEMVASPQATTNANGWLASPSSASRQPGMATLMSGEFQSALSLNPQLSIGARKVTHLNQQASTPSGTFLGSSRLQDAPNVSSTNGTDSRPTASVSNGFARYASQQQAPPRSDPSSSQPAQQRFASTNNTNIVDSNRSSAPLTQQPQRAAAAGRIPVISSASGAKVPSSSLPATSAGAGTSTAAAPGTKGSLKDYYRMQSANVSARMNSLAEQGLIPPRARTMSGGYPSAPSVTSPSGALVSPVSDRPVVYKQKSRDMIDLTGEDNSDPDEIIVEDKIVCIGQLTSLALILYAVPELVPEPAKDAQGVPLPDHLQSQAPALPQPPLPIHILRADKQGQNETLKLVTPGSRDVFGCMEHKVANVLGPLLGNGWSGTGITTEIKGKVWCEASVVRRGERNPMMLPLRLLLFARTYDVPFVADLLEKQAIYLEHPITYNPKMHHDAPYQNPHNPGANSRDAERRRTQFLSGMIGGSGLIRSVNNVEVQREQVESVWKSLKSGPDLPEVEPPATVRTKLYPHQKQALSFLLDREKLQKITDRDPKGGGKPTRVSLWERQQDPFGRVRGWKNLVSDLEIAGESPPPQTRGAILADDMGLGKTIVIISLVATTLAEARDWCTQPITGDSGDERVQALAKQSKPSTGVSISDFTSNLYGLADTGQNVPKDPNAPLVGANGRPLSKKAQAKLKRERKRDELQQARFKRLACRSRATLIICPLSTIQNWESQFEEHTADGDGSRSYTINVHDEQDYTVEEGESSSDDNSSFGRLESQVNGKKKRNSKAISVYVYHGNSRIAEPHKLADYDVVLTTFSTLGTEYSKQCRAEDEREAEVEERKRRETNDSEDEPLTVFGYGAKGEVIETKPGDDVVKAGKPLRKRKRVECDYDSPLQQIQWFRVVLDEAHIIKEHTTIQARAACDLSTYRRVCLSGTPLQNSLNDLFSLIRFLRLEPFTDRAVWNQHIGALAKMGDKLGVQRLQLIMRHLCLRRTKESKDKNGQPILRLPPVSHQMVKLELDPQEHAFYSSHHSRYKHDFQKLEETDSVMKNFCSILQELLRLRQICVHMSLVRDAEDLANAEDGDLIKTIVKHGISKPRAIKLLSMMKDAGAGQCAECGQEMLAGSSTGAAKGDEDEGTAATTSKRKPPARKRTKTKSASASAQNTDDDGDGAASKDDRVAVITRCQHLFCRQCFTTNVCPQWGGKLPHDVRAACSQCREEMTPILDAVEVTPTELERAVEQAKDELAEAETQKGGRRAKKVKGERLLEMSTKTRALLQDLMPFSQANPATDNFDNQMSVEGGDKVSATIGFQPVKGEVVKSVVFSQWTKYLDRIGDALDAVKIRYGRLDGGMNRDQRTQAMDTFKSDPRCEVLLVSLRAGGVGLNLTAARRVYLMEPFWNPAVENQAVDRIYRLGQTHSVQTVRFIIRKSIEANMLKIQKRKTALANMSITQSRSKAELAKERLEDFRIMLSMDDKDSDDEKE